MSENYIYAIEVGENEVPIKLEYPLTKADSKGNTINVKTTSDTGITMATSEGHYCIINPTSDGSSFFIKDIGNVASIDMDHKVNQSIKLQYGNGVLQVKSDGVTVMNGTSTILKCTPNQTWIYSDLSANAATFDSLDVTGEIVAESDVLFECDVTTLGTIMVDTLSARYDIEDTQDDPRYYTIDVLSKISAPEIRVDTLSARYDVEDTQDGPEYNTLSILSPVTVPHIATEGGASFGHNVTVDGNVTVTPGYRINASSLRGPSTSRDSSSHLFIYDHSEVYIGPYVTLAHSVDSRINSSDSLDISPGVYSVIYEYYNVECTHIFVVPMEDQEDRVILLPGVNDVAIVIKYDSSNSTYPLKLRTSNDDGRPIAESIRSNDYTEYGIFDANDSDVRVVQLTKLFGTDYHSGVIVDG